MLIIDTNGLKLDESRNDPMVDITPVYRALLVDGKQTGGYSIAVVKYDPGTKLRWHTHDSEQIIMGTEGKGILATREKENIISPGMIVVIPPNEVHYHGAAPGHSFTHIAFYSGKSQIL